jgi:hypothetical protein
VRVLQLFFGERFVSLLATLGGASSFAAPDRALEAFVEIHNLILWMRISARNG